VASSETNPVPNPNPCLYKSHQYQYVTTFTKTPQHRHPHCDMHKLYVYWNMHVVSGARHGYEVYTAVTTEFQTGRDIFCVPGTDL
jgi:hypothetical protein